MRAVIISTLVVGLAACQGAGTAGGGAEFSDVCNARAQQDLVGGRIADMASLAVAAPKVRFIDPGDSVTQDQQPDRLNIVRDGNGVVTRVYCG
ncbi:I78 family peptidase inhibitor [Halovulum marinum]|nr:I78 family peptidase inhibitor [Halovulum marinum]